MSRRSRGYSPVTIQVSIQYAMPKGRKRTMPKKILEQVFHQWIDSGETPDPFEIKTIHWVHNGEFREGSDDEETRKTLGRLLQGGGTLNFKVRGT